MPILLEIEMGRVDDVVDGFVYVQYVPKNEELKNYANYGDDLPVVTTVEDAIALKLPYATQAIFTAIESVFPGEYYIP